MKAPPAALKSLKWCEIATRPERARFEALSKVLAKHGCENSLEFIELADPDADFDAALQKATGEFAQIRFGLSLLDQLSESVQNWPSDLFQFKVADTFVRTVEPSGTVWWPRCFLVDGLNYIFAKSSIPLDLNGGVLIIGAGASSYATVMSLARVGFRRFGICDVDDARAELVVERLKDVQYGVDFQAVPRLQLTQLPGVYSVAVNTIARPSGDRADSDALSILEELVYFNFLMPQGVWLDLNLSGPERPLDLEAQSAGAVVRTAAEVAAATDCAWARACCGLDLSYAELLKQYESLSG